MDNMDRCVKKISVQGHGVSTTWANYELMTTPINICTIISIVGSHRVVLLHADSSMTLADVHEIVEQEGARELSGVKPKVKYVCSRKPGQLEQWMDAMDGQLPEFTYPKRCRIKFSGGKFSMCEVDESTEGFYHLPKTDLCALVDTECLWASLYFTDAIRFNPIILDTPSDLKAALVAAGNALSVVQLLSFDGSIKEVQVDAFLRRYWKTTILGKFLEEFAPHEVRNFQKHSHLSVAEVLNKAVITEKERQTIEDMVVDYGILVLSFLDTLKDYHYPTLTSKKDRNERKTVRKLEKARSEPSFVKAQCNSISRNPTLRNTNTGENAGASSIQDSIGKMTVNTTSSDSSQGNRNQPASRLSSFKLFEKKR